MEEGSWLHPGVPWIDILSYVSAEDLLRLRRTCLTLREQAGYEGLWKPHCAALFSFSPEPHCSWRESFTYLAATPFLSAETYRVYLLFIFFFLYFSLLVTKWWGLPTTTIRQVCIATTCSFSRRAALEYLPARETFQTMPIASICLASSGEPIDFAEITKKLLNSLIDFYSF
jgi:hypothetical protein